jgi:hypothetical protein
MVLMRRKSAAALCLCLWSHWASLAVNGPGPDAFGYKVAATTNYSFLQITNGSSRVLWFTDDGAVTNINLGFSFSFYGTNYTNVSFNANGLMTFGGASMAYSNVNLTTTGPADNLPSVAVLWDDWETQSPGSDGVYYKTTGTFPSRQFVVQWNKVIPVNGTGTNPVTFEARLFEGSGGILLSYWQTVVVESSQVASLGAGATVGIRDVSGQSNGRNLQWSFNQPVITNGLNLLFAPPIHPPVIAGASITPSAPTRTNALLAVVTSATDPQGIPINYAYQWQQSTNNAAFVALAGQSAGTLSAAATRAGFYYRVVITPNDGLTNGAAFTTAAVQVALDADGNGINDDWEVQYFGYIGVNPNADADGDGMSNYQEYLAGTNPTNGASNLRVTSLAVTGNDVAVNWTTVGGKSYVLQTSSVPGGFSDFTPVIAIPGTGEAVTNYLDQNARVNWPLRVYRVRLVQ